MNLVNLFVSKFELFFHLWSGSFALLIKSLNSREALKNWKLLIHGAKYLTQDFSLLKERSLFMGPTCMWSYIPQSNSVLNEHLFRFSFLGKLLCHGEQKKICLCLWVSVCLCLGVCMCMCVHTCLCVCVGQRRVLGGLIYCSLPYFLGTGSLVKSKV